MGVADGIKLQITTSWARAGDGDLVVRTPSGKLIHGGNRGPGIETADGTLNRIASAGVLPEPPAHVVCFTYPGGP